MSDDVMDVPIDISFKMLYEKKEDKSKLYREYRRRWNENPKSFIVEDFPIHLDIETNTNCNLRCFMCPQSFDTPLYKEMEPWFFKKLVDEGTKKGLCSIKTQYRGEPLLYRYTPDLVRYAKDRGVLEVMFNTNATLLDEVVSRKLIVAGLDKIICSIDGFRKEDYESIRIGGDFDTVLSNVKRFQSLKKTFGNDGKPVMRIQMVDTPRNKYTVDEYVAFWSKIADNVGYADMIDYHIQGRDVTPLPNWACSTLWQRIFVLADGDVTPCCRAVMGGNRKLCVLGNAHETAISDIWKGKGMERIRELHKSGNSHMVDMCTMCGARKMEIEKRKNKQPEINPGGFQFGELIYDL